VLVVTAAARLPRADAAVWFLTSLMAVSVLGLAVAVWWVTAWSRSVEDGLVQRWGLATGFVLGGLWLAEIAFNNLTPSDVSTAANRGVVDNTTWAVVGVATLVLAAVVTVRTGRLVDGVLVGAWSGVGSGLGASLGGAVLLAFFRGRVEDDPLMRAEFQQRGSGLDVASYVTRETISGVIGHLWILGIVQGAVLGLIAAAGTGIVRTALSGSRS
jgi:hypothetical protein